MKYVFFSCLLQILLSSCNPVSENKSKPIHTPIQIQPTTFDWNGYNLIRKPTDKLYSKVLEEIQKSKKSTDSISVFFENALVNQIIPYWYGTPWDFNGHTNIPNEGEIACGYFVSTTLKHMGLNINRYKLAQQLPIHEAKTLSLGNKVLEIEADNFEKCFEKIKATLKSGIYFIGLDASHVGFLLKRKKEFFFIHSNYGTPQEVIIELAQESDVLKSFSHFYITEISKNKTLMNHWKTNKNIPVITK